MRLPLVSDATKPEWSFPFSPASLRAYRFARGLHLMKYPGSRQSVEQAKSLVDVTGNICSLRFFILHYFVQHAAREIN